MASSWTFGRIGVPTTAGGDGLELSAHYVVPYGGDELTIEADLDQTGATAVADQKILRDQFRAYDDNTDDIIPVTSTQDTSLNGYYAVEKVDVADTNGTHFTGGIGSHVTCDLVRIPGWQAPRHQIATFGNIRPNSHSVVIGTTLPWWAPGGAATAIDRRGVLATGPVSATGADGAILRFYKATPTTYETWASWNAEPADFYRGAARIETSHDTGTTWRTVTGEQVRNLPTYWRVANSLMRVTATTTASVTELSCEWHDGSAWDAAKVFRLTQDSSWTDLARTPISITVMHNGPERVTVRVGLGSSITYDRIYLDVTLRRGARYVECYLSEDGTANLSGVDYGIKRTVAEAVTSIHANGAFRATSTDADGNKFVLASTKAGASDLTNGRLRANDPPFTFMIGSAVGGTAGSGFDETGGLVNQWLASMEWTFRTVAT